MKEGGRGVMVTFLLSTRCLILHRWLKEGGKKTSPHLQPLSSCPPPPVPPLPTARLYPTPFPAAVWNSILFPL